MGKSFFVFFFSLSIVLHSCSSAKKASYHHVNQGITGYVKKITGNQMPSPDIKRPSPKGMKATVYVYEITNISQVAQEGSSPFYSAIHTKLIDTVSSDSSGHFLIGLPEGSYSLFIKVKGKFYANSFDGANNISVALVKKKKLTEIDLLMSDGAVY